MPGPGGSRPIIFLDLNKHDPRFRLIAELAKEREWKVLWLAHSIDESIRPDGAIIQALPGSELALRLQKTKCPTVRLGSYPHRDDRLLPAVLPDLRRAGKLAAEHFARRQYRQVAFVAFHAEEKGKLLHPMYKSYFSASQKLGMECQYISTDYPEIQEHSWEERRRAKMEAYKRMIASLPKPLGVFTGRDQMGFDLCQACAESGVQVPEEVAVVGYGDTPACQMVPVQLSSVDPDPDRCVLEAFDLLACLMDGEPNPKRRVMVPPRAVIDRESTDVLAAADPTVRQALRFMWDHLDEDLAVEDVLDVVGVSYSVLNRKLKKNIGRGFAGELRRKRIERTCELLRNTRLTVEEIAGYTGFQGKNYLHRVFQQEMGMTPQTYRKQNRED